MKAAELRGIRYRFPNATADALRDVDWEIPSGSFNLLVGPSGSGKTTLLRTLNGLVPHFHGGYFGGQALIFEHDSRNVGPRELAGLVGTVFQDPEAQCITDNVEDEIVFGLEQLGVPRHEMARRLDLLLERLAIGQLRDRALSTLSGGERQRVVLAAALVLQPRLLALDEPTSQLDPAGADAFLEALTDLDETTIVIAEHRLERLLPVATCLALMSHGALRTGVPRELAAELPEPPPVVELGRRLGWQPLPLSVVEARSHIPLPLPAQPRRPKQSESSGEVVLQVQGIDVRLGDAFVLRELSFTLHAGAVVALIGPNGSGKTTLLKAIVGLLRPDSGSVVLGNQSTREMAVPKLARDIGYVPQHPTAILHQETLWAELAFTLRVQRKQGDIDGTLAALGIAEYAGQHPLDLSGGERQRAALAALAVAAPRLLLLDEPTRGLPAAEKARLGQFLAEYARLGRAVLVVTHDAEFVAHYARRVLRLDAGRLVGDGPPAVELPASESYRTQLNRLFGDTALTLDDIELPVAARVDA